MPLDAERRHSVRRVLIWITPFGEGIRRVCKRELMTGRSIRWTDSKVYAAEAYSLRSAPVYDRLSEIKERLAAEEPEAEPTRECVPAGVPHDQLERWHAAIALAFRQNPQVGSQRLWEAAVQIFGSARSTEALGEELGGRWLARDGSPPLRLRRGALGQLSSPRSADQ